MTIAGPYTIGKLAPLWDSTKTGKPGPYKKLENQDPSVTLQKTERPRPSWDLGGTLQKLENQESNEALRKPEKGDTVRQLGPKTRKAGPNVTPEKLYNCKCTFICLLLRLKFRSTREHLTIQLL